MILGIDPGLAIVGWGVVDYDKSKFRTVAYGSLQTPANTPTEKRLHLIFGGMQELLEKYENKISKAYEVLGWRAEFDIEKMLAEQSSEEVLAAIQEEITRVLKEREEKVDILFNKQC